LSLKTKRWLPGNSTKGEGIFIVFDEKKLTTWSNFKNVKTRTQKIQNRLNELRRQRDLDSREITPTLILIHTFAHVLIRQMSFECGYDASSMRERLYIHSDDSDTMNGVLIYTASGDSEGTLGGLVRQGEPDRLDKTLQAAIVNASICSSDPLCIESDGQGLYTLNISACHACCLLPETSCEEGNLLLDRGLLIGTPEDEALGYFNHLINS
jgi:hypothetical protein